MRPRALWQLEVKLDTTAGGELHRQLVPVVALDDAGDVHRQVFHAESLSPPLSPRLDRDR